MRFNERFERLLRLYRKPDGSEWSPTDIQRATNNFVNLSYVSNLRAGRIRKPGLDKLRAIASAMGFPWELWLEDLEDWDSVARQKDVSRDFTEALNQAFDVVENFRTQARYTTQEVANLSGGRLTTGEVEAMRRGKVDNPSMGQLLALSDVFGVDPGYWFRSSSDRALLDQKTLEALRDPEAQFILHKSVGIPQEDRSILLQLLDRLRSRSDRAGDKDNVK